MSKQRKQLNKILKIWNWIKIISLLLGLICSSILIYKYWTKRQELERLQVQLRELKEQAQKQYQLQENYFSSTASLVNSPVIHSFFSDLLKTYAEKFAKSKELNTSQLPSLKFAGFYYDEKNNQGLGTMEHCFPRQLIHPYEEETINIELNRLYLLNKLGNEHYFTSNPEKSNDYTYIDISFDKMIDTCSHELAHYIQLAKHGKSSCEGDLKLGNGKYDTELAQEHKEFSQEIYQMIKKEFSQWEKRWKEI